MCGVLQMFLLTACLDMTVYVHSLTTGSPLHTLRAHQSQVSYTVQNLTAGSPLTILRAIRAR